MIIIGTSKPERCSWVFGGDMYGCCDLVETNRLIMTSDGKHVVGEMAYFTRDQVSGNTSAYYGLLPIFTLDPSTLCFFLRLIVLRVCLPLTFLAVADTTIFRLFHQASLPRKLLWKHFTEYLHLKW